MDVLLEKNLMVFRLRLYRIADYSPRPNVLFGEFRRSYRDLKPNLNTSSVAV